MRIHFLSNSLKTNSGFAIVTKNLALGLQKLGHQVSMTGMQTSVTPEFSFGVEQLPLATNLDEMSQFQKNIMQSNPDVVIYVMEMYTDARNFAKIFPKTIVYCPSEGVGLPQYVVNDLNQIIKNGGKIVSQCNYGQKQMLKAGVKETTVIYHGVNPDIFYPIDKKDLVNHSKYCYYHTEQGKESIGPRMLCKQDCYSCSKNINEQQNCPYYKEELITFTKYINDQWTETNDMPLYKIQNELKGKFIFLTVGQNHLLRKRFERLLEAYSILINESKQLKDKTHLHLHSNPQSPTGIDLLKVVNDLNIRNNVSFSYGTWRSSGFSENGLNILYNLSDIQVTASSSEGYGLTSNEGFATGLPIVAPDNTSFTELIENTISNKTSSNNTIGPRGLLAKISDYHIVSDLTSRALVDVRDLSDKMKQLFLKKNEREIYGDNAIKFVRLYTWDNIISDWSQLLYSMK